MKRSPGSSDSLGALMSICPNLDEHSPRNNNIYSREFESLLDGLDEEGCCAEESGGHGGAAGKKRRLSVDQVKALEKNFEVENKLEPDRKVKLAQELGLQPRQVAVWFQNRRARWKTKQLERDYGVLKTSYETLKANFNTLQHDNEALLKEIRELKAKINGDSEESNGSVKEEVNHCFPSNGSLDIPSNNSNGSPVGGGDTTVFPDLKDGSSDSDSSAVLNEEHNNNNGGSSSPNNEAFHLLMSPTTDSSLNFNSSSSSSSPSSMDCFQLSKTICYQTQHYQQYVKMEDQHDFISSTADEVCNFFSDEQAPSLHWYSPEQWI